jgi:hypothetical protein
MTTKAKEKQSSMLDIALIIMGMILFPAIILAGFTVHANAKAFIFTLAASQSITGCQALNSISKTNQCIGWAAPDSLRVLSFIGVIILITYGLLMLYRIRLLAHDGAKQFAQLHLATAGIATITTSILYAQLRNHSSQAHTYAGNQQSDGSWFIPHAPTIGFGLLPELVVLLSILYLLPALLNYYRLMNPLNVGGQKPGALFQ